MIFGSVLWTEQCEAIASQHPKVFNSTTAVGEWTAILDSPERNLQCIAINCRPEDHAMLRDKPIIFEEDFLAAIT